MVVRLGFSNCGELDICGVSLDAEGSAGTERQGSRGCTTRLNVSSNF